MSEINLQHHMSAAIRRIMLKAYSNVLRNPLEAKTVWRLQQTFLQSEKRRAAVKDNEGLEVPPFLICSISTSCNLHCKGCYARSNGIASDNAADQKPSLSPEQWKAIFEEASSLGINFALLAGGEPMMRKVNRAVFDFIGSLMPEKVKCVVLFGSSAIIDSPVPQMFKALKERGIKVCDKSFTCKGSMGPVHKGHPDNKDIDDFRQFCRSLLD